MQMKLLPGQNFSRTKPLRQSRLNSQEKRKTNDSKEIQNKNKYRSSKNQTGRKKSAGSAERAFGVLYKKRI